MNPPAALVVKAIGKPMLSGFCAHSGRHDPICQTVRAHLAPTPVGARP